MREPDSAVDVDFLGDVQVTNMKIFTVTGICCSSWNSCRDLRMQGELNGSAWVNDMLFVLLVDICQLKMDPGAVSAVIRNMESKCMIFNSNTRRAFFFSSLALYSA